MIMAAASRRMLPTLGLGSKLLLCLLSMQCCSARLGTRSRVDYSAAMLRQTQSSNARRMLPEAGPAAATALAILDGQTSSNDSQEHFVRIDANGDFVYGCKKFFFLGWNQWEAAEAGAGVTHLYGSVLPANVTAAQMVRDLMALAVANRLTVMRCWAFAVSKEYALQPSPGVYNEAIFAGLDYVLDEARKAGVKLILSLTTSWGDTGTVGEYVSWSPTSRTQKEFYTDLACRQLFKDFVSQVLRRTNTINGRAYANDPTIFAWDLINEPRCPACTTELHDWIEDMAAYVKGLDKAHLVTVGEEGFYLRGRQAGVINPRPSWAKYQGQDYLMDCSAQGIDFCTFHSWVDNWQVPDIGFQQRWIEQHAQDAAALGKPAVLEEFGKWIKAGTNATLAERNHFYQTILAAVEKSAEISGAIKGAAFWLLLAPGQTAPVSDGGGGGLYGVYPSDKTWDFIVSSAQVLADLQVPTSCVEDPMLVLAANDCQNTWVNGISGTGYEGPNCSRNINECVRGTATCPINSGCVDTQGSYVCPCYFGFGGDGACNPTPALQLLTRQYSTPGPSQVACEQGYDVIWPPGSPGYLDDITTPPNSSSVVQMENQSKSPVTIFDCQLACSAALRCTSFAYNQLLQRCYLKAGEGASVCQSPVTNCTQQDQSGNTVTFSCGSWQTFYRDSQPVSASVAASSLKRTQDVPTHG